MDRTESGWGQDAEPAPRWRALLDRALLGRGGDQQVSAPPVSPPAPRGRPDGRRYRPLDQPYPDGQAAPDRAAEQPFPGAGHAGRAGPPPSPGPTYARSGYAEPTYPEPPAYAEPAYPEAGYAGPAYAEPGYAEPGYAEPGYAEPRYAEPSYAEPDQLQSSFANRAHPTRTYPGQGRPEEVEWRQAATPDDATARAIASLRRDLVRPRVLAFANPKGGVHKTTATALAAASIGSVRGRGVLAWDDNELRGTLGLRAGSARHARTIRHLVADLAEVEASGGLELADRVDDYLRHASDGTYDVLAGEENPRFAQQLDRATVRRVLELLRRTYDVICVDTGNNVESANWQTVLQAADLLVVTTVPREDAAFTADWMLDLLHDQGMGQLVAGAVTLLSCATPGPQPLLEDLRAHFASRTRAVAVVPYDPALESGSSIEPAMLEPATRQAWLTATATMLDHLSG